MCLKLMSAVWCTEIPDSRRKLILLSLADNADEATRECFPSVSYIARRCGCTRRTVHRHLSILEDEGLITRVHQFTKDGKKRSNIYILAPINHDGLLMGQNDTYATKQHIKPPEKHHECPIVCDTDDIGVCDTGVTYNHHIEPSLESIDRSFERFWETYPRKVSKKKAQQAFKKYEHLADKIIADIEIRLKLDAQWQDKTFIPHPTTYLNGERWNDDITPIEEKQKAAQLPKNVNDLMVFGTKMGLPALPGEDEHPYRQRLQAAL